MEVFEDINSVYVTILDKKTPVVVFLGPPASGKTFALLRMTRYLMRYGYDVMPEVTFRPSSDRFYAKTCSTFHHWVYDNDLSELGRWYFLMVKVFNQGKPVCQIIKIPGGHFYDDVYNNDFPDYINVIRCSENRKVWVFFVEQGWGYNQAVRDLYAQNICCMQELISPNDKVVFLFNKADRQRTSGQYDKTGKPHKKLFFNQIKREYPGIFTRYKNHGLKKLIYGEYDIKTVCFSSGIFSNTQDGREVWCPSDDSYCSQFWGTIQKLIK